MHLGVLLDLFSVHLVLLAQAAVDSCGQMFARLYTSSSCIKNSISSSSFYIALSTTVRITHLFRTSAKCTKPLKKCINALGGSA